MAKQVTESIGKLMGLRYKSHPWHGIDIGPDTPEIVTCYIEMVPIDTVKYEVDKVSGYLKIDRPQKYSNQVPTLYGFIPQTYSGDLVAGFNAGDQPKKISGDNDPIDICVLTEKVISHGDILVKARPIGSLRMIDNNHADDKIIAVLKDDAVYGQYRDISDVPTKIIDRLKHYFLTYKDLPGEERDCYITSELGIQQTHELIRLAVKDYRYKFANLESILSAL
ncbi:MAG: inorganic pyrophosphatase [Bacteroides sp. SM23_62]|nr:MAG: inorganic pyrophosphatase [Bacteroides sp. SM23_62]